MKITRWLIVIFIIVALTLPLMASAEEVDYTDLWCSPGYTCIECVAFSSLEACDDYKRLNEPPLSQPPVWDLIFDELGLIRPPEYSDIQRLKVAADMVSIGRQLNWLYFWR